jgi:hypothetical protein
LREVCDDTRNLRTPVRELLNVEADFGRGCWGVRCWNGVADTALVVSALGSKREDWMRMLRIERMLGQQLNGND